MLHPHTEVRFISPEIGSGVFATSPLPKGTITWVQDPLDQVIDLEAQPEYRDYPPTLERYSFRNADGHYVLCWDQARFVNHNCQANCLSPGLDFEICIRDIQQGEELTNDYGSLNLEFQMECSCRAPGCRGVTQPGDFENLAPQWDKLLQMAFPQIAKVDQPLWSRLADPDLVLGCLAKKRPIPSIFQHHFSPETKLNQKARAFL